MARAGLVLKGFGFGCEGLLEWISVMVVQASGNRMKL